MTMWLPPELNGPTLLCLTAAAFLAGFVDSIVGGGGLVQLPAMFAMFPAAPPAFLLGTNKLASVFGTSAAAVHYARRTRVEWNAALPATLAALVFASLGAWAVSRVPADRVRDVLPFILTAVAGYIFFRKDLGVTHAPVHRGKHESARGAAVGSAIGFYDGFVGPGTGSFLVFLFVRLFGFDFLSASAAAKIVNVACNVSAIAVFAALGKIWVGLSLVMGVFNVGGSIVGSRLAIRHGSSFVRKLFLVVVSLLIFKTAYDAIRH